jgi:hypothetical protein
MVTLSGPYISLWGKQHTFLHFLGLGINYSPHLQQILYLYKYIPTFYYTEKHPIEQTFLSAL